MSRHSHSRRAPIAFVAVQLADGRMIGDRLGSDSVLDAAPVTPGAMVIPGRRIRSIRVPVEQGGRRTVVPRSHVEMRGHATSGVITDHVMRYRCNLGPVAIENGDPHPGKPEDLGKKREIDALRPGLESSDSRLMEAEQGRQVALTQVALAPYAHDEPRHVDTRRVTHAVRSLRLAHGPSMHGTTDAAAPTSGRCWWASNPPDSDTDSTTASVSESGDAAPGRRRPV